jgi:hypothetical protein
MYGPRHCPPPLAEAVSPITAEHYLLGQINWQVMGTLTFRDERLPEARRLSMWFALLRAFAAECNVYFLKLLWALRLEGGGKFGRLHFHFLIAALPQHAVTPSMFLSMEAKWQRLRGGSARVTEYVSALRGADYLLKRLGQTLKEVEGMESAKFGIKSRELMLSDSLWAVLKGRQ